jgi:acyl-coenzyme A synthetase/AMP-(fatty) acid ligase
LAVIGSSCRWTGTNIAYTVPELKHHIETSDSKYVITSIEHIDTVRSAAGAAEVIIFTDILADAPSSPLGGFRSLHDLQTKATAEEMFTTIQHLDVNAIAMLSSTSGTTGRPKMAARTQRSLILESAAVEDGPRPYYVRRLYCTPIFHGLSAPEMVGFLALHTWFFGSR